ncbi:hypothetical protein QBC40DRAFT_264423 [Triangularia verruculosa]|uniref:Uncharacterized protein n=1 Tax=Triangularia verruculosa TaxID=2587418 RepID=A0AAN6XKE5_9PEZI|nr:hypothetical protein QBC40DRAFT_264423 [Triangularia verruculosa]
MSSARYQTLRAHVGDCISNVKTSFSDCLLSGVLVDNYDWLESQAGAFNIWAATSITKLSAAPGLENRQEDWIRALEVVSEILKALHRVLVQLLCKCDLSHSFVAFLLTAVGKCQLGMQQSSSSRSTIAPSVSMQSIDWREYSETGDSESGTVTSNYALTNPFHLEKLYIQSALDQLSRLTVVLDNLEHDLTGISVENSLATSQGFDFTVFRDNLEGLIRSSHYQTRPTTWTAMPLTPVQQRLVYLNVLRRHQIPRTNTRPSLFPKIRISRPGKERLDFPLEDEQLRQFYSFLHLPGSATTSLLGKTQNKSLQLLDLSLPSRSVSSLAASVQSGPTLVNELTRPDSRYSFSEAATLKSEVNSIYAPPTDSRALPMFWIPPAPGYTEILHSTPIYNCPYCEMSIRVDDPTNVDSYEQWG